MKYLFALFVQAVSIGAMEIDFTGVEGKSVAIKMIELAIAKSHNKLIEEIDFSEREINNLLETVDAEHKKIDQKVPRTIQSYRTTIIGPVITCLNLSNNKLEDLPEDLKELSHIEVFCGSRNKFKAIPAVIRHWKSTLISLDISCNEVESIERIGSEPLANFKRLRWLNIERNKIQDLPCEELYEMYLGQRIRNIGLTVCVDHQYELNDDLERVKEKVFYKTFQYNSRYSFQK